MMRRSAGLLASVLVAGCAVSHSAQRGPFNTSCTIEHRGTAALVFVNRENQAVKLTSFTLHLARQDGRSLRAASFSSATPAEFPPKTSRNITVLVTHSAASCSVAVAR
jgi:hypothetical protein